MAEKALTAIQEAYIQGVSTRSVDDAGRHLQEPARSTASQGFLERPLRASGSLARPI